MWENFRIHAVFCRIASYWTQARVVYNSRHFLHLSLQLFSRPSNPRDQFSTHHYTINFVLPRSFSTSSLSPSFRSPELNRPSLYCHTMHQLNILTSMASIISNLNSNFTFYGIVTPLNIFFIKKAFLRLEGPTYSATHGGGITGIQMQTLRYIKSNLQLLNSPLTQLISLVIAETAFNSSRISHVVSHGDVLGSDGNSSSKKVALQVSLWWKTFLLYTFKVTSTQ